MVNNATNRIQTTRSITWITTFLIETTSIQRTIIICDTFRISADGIFVDYMTIAIRLAWCWEAWICWFVFYGNRSTFNEWIADRLIWT